MFYVPSLLGHVPVKRLLPGPGCIPHNTQIVPGCQAAPDRKEYRCGYRWSDRAPGEAGRLCPSPWPPLASRSSDRLSGCTLTVPAEAAPPTHGHVQRTAAPADRNHTSVCPIATSKTPCMSQCLKSHTFRSFHLHNPHFLTSRVWLWTRQASPVWGGRHLASARSPPAPGVRPRPLPCPTLPLSPTLRCEKGTVAGGSGIPGCLLVPRTAPEAARGPGPHPPG